MLDFLRNLTKSEQERKQEAVTAYLDGMLTAKELVQFEQQLSADQELRTDLEQQRLVKENLQQIPRLRAPRNFTLDPALYGRPQPARALYPALRTATALAVFLLIFAVSADFVIRMVESPEATALRSATGTEGGISGAVAEEAPLAPETFEGEVPASEAPVAEESVRIESEDVVATVEVEAELVEEPAEAVEEAAEPAPAVAAEAPTQAESALAEAVPTMIPEPSFEAQELDAGGAASERQTVPTTGGAETTMQPLGTPGVKLQPTGSPPATALAQVTVAAEATALEAVGARDEGVTAIPLIRFIEFGLVLIVVLLSAATLFVRHRT